MPVGANGAGQGCPLCPQLRGHGCRDRVGGPGGCCWWFCPLHALSDAEHRWLLVLCLLVLMYGIIKSSWCLQARITNDKLWLLNPKPPDVLTGTAAFPELFLLA